MPGLSVVEVRLVYSRQFATMSSAKAVRPHCERDMIQAIVGRPPNSPPADDRCHPFTALYMSPYVELKFAALTDTGMVRAHNEDSIACLPEYGLAVLADGMGGHRGGEIASGIATAIVQDTLTQQLGQTSPPLEFVKAKKMRHIMEQAVQHANSAIFTTAMQHAEYAGMGTTLVVAIFRHDYVVLANIGDSRAYRIRDQSMVQLTRDHSYLQEQIDAGFLSQEEARVSENRNLVTRALGIESIANADIDEHATLPGDIFLLCSDGLTDMLNDARILAEIVQPGTLAEACERLVRQANLHGGADNISVMLVRVASHANKPHLSARIRQWITS